MEAEILKSRKYTAPRTSPVHRAALRTYQNRSRSTISESQIIELLPMIPRITRRVASYIKPPLSFEDLVSAGTLGLIKAAQNFKSDQNAEFKTYAHIRIKGAILDELKKWSFIPSEMSKKITQTYQTAKEITETTGFAPSEEQLAEHMDTSVKDIYKIFENARARQFLSLDYQNETAPAFVTTLSHDTLTPDEKLEKKELSIALADAIQKLDKRKCQIIVLYYQQQLSMKQIAKVYDITEARVSQLHAAALFDLSVTLKEFDNDK